MMTVVFAAPDGVVGVHPTSVAQNCLVRNAWWCPDYLSTRRAELVDAVTAHLTITVVSVLLGVLLALPLALVGRRHRRSGVALRGVSTALYTVPSLALFSLLLPYTGLSPTTVVIGLTLYSLTILLRSFSTGLAGVPADVVDAARGMGYSPGRLLWRVELPLALPVMMSGVRVATVSTVALTTVGTIVGNGGLGDLIYSGLRTGFRAQVLTASVLCVLLAVLADLLLVALERAALPWRRVPTEEDGSPPGRAAVRVEVP